jgi:hypothetical protein
MEVAERDVVEAVEERGLHELGPSDGQELLGVRRGGAGHESMGDRKGRHPPMASEGGPPRAEEVGEDVRVVARSWGAVVGG